MGVIAARFFCCTHPSPPPQGEGGIALCANSTYVGGRFDIYDEAVGIPPSPALPRCGLRPAREGVFGGGFCVSAFFSVYIRLSA